MAKAVSNSGEVFKQVGVIGIRDPDGNITENRPIYIKVGEKEINPKTNMHITEEKAMEDVMRVLAEKFKQYVDGCKEAGVDIGI